MFYLSNLLAAVHTRLLVQILLFRSLTGDVLAPNLLIYVQSPYW